MKIFPVVHVDMINDLKAARRDSNSAFELGADGIYLINHRNSKYKKEAIFETYNSIKEESDDRYVGLNILDCEPRSAMHVLAKALGKKGSLISPPDGFWIYDIHSDSQTKSAMEFKKEHPILKQTRLLGGIAIRGTGSFTTDPDRAQYETEYLLGLVDVVMTSGHELWQPPNVEKLIAMKKVMGNKALAVLGGISADNAHQYYGTVDEVFINARVEQGSYYGIFNEHKLEELIKTAHSLAK